MIDHQTSSSAYCRQQEREGLNAAYLRRFWIPAQPLPEAEFVRLFQRIDEALQ